MTPYSGRQRHGTNSPYTLGPSERRHPSVVRDPVPLSSPHMPALSLPRSPMAQTRLPKDAPPTHCQVRKSAENSIIPPVLGLIAPLPTSAGSWFALEIIPASPALELLQFQGKLEPHTPLRHSSLSGVCPTTLTRPGFPGCYIVLNTAYL